MSNVSLCDINLFAYTQWNTRAAWCAFYAVHE